jgi:hypothetical protein
MLTVTLASLCRSQHHFMMNSRNSNYARCHNPHRIQLNLRFQLQTPHRHNLQIIRELIHVEQCKHCPCRFTPFHISLWKNRLPYGTKCIQWIRQTPYVVAMWRTDSYCSGPVVRLPFIRFGYSDSGTVADSDAKHHKHTFQNIATFQSYTEPCSIRIMPK